MSADDARARRRELLARRLQRGAGEGREKADAFPGIPTEPGAPGPIDLSPYQRPLWLHHRLYPESRAAYVLRGYGSSSVLDRPRLERAVAELSRRHGLLTAAISGEGRLIPRDATVPFGWHDATDDPWTAAATYARGALPPFDLEAGELFRVHVFASAGRSVLLFCVHHVIADGRSLDRLVRELASLYRGETPTALHEPDPGAVSRWLQDRARERAASNRTFWREVLGELPAVRPLALARSPAARATHRGGLERSAVPDELSRATLAEAARLGASPFQYLLAVWMVLLARHLETNDVVTGTPVSLRTRRELGSQLGYFLNTIVLRARFGEADSFEEIVGQIREITGKAIAHAELPFDELSRLAPHAGRTFSAFFALVESDPEPIVFDAAVEEERELEHGGAVFDLSMLVVHRGGALSLAIEFDEGVYERSEVALLFDHYVALLEQVVRQPGRAWRSPSLLRSKEMESLREQERSIRDAPQAEALLQDAFLRQARDRPDATAILWRGGESSYGALAEQAAGIAARLGAAGAVGGSPVAVLARPGASLVAAMIGTLEAGAVYLPVDPDYPASRIRAILDDAGVGVVLLGDDVEPPDGALQGRTPIVAAEAAREPGRLRRAELSPASPAYLIYTSGSTGRPKGVRVSHRAAVYSTDQRGAVYGPGGPERFLLLSSPAFDSSMVGLWWTLSSGGALCMLDASETRAPEVLVERIRQWGVTHTLCLPTLWRGICRMADNGPPLPVKQAIVAGEACTTDTVRAHFRAAPDAELFNEYGPTEMTVWSTVHRLGPEQRDPVPIGKPIPLCQALVTDAAGNVLPRGVPGELRLAGPGMADGYHGDPTATALAFGPHPLGARSRAYATGDRVLARADGTLTFLGRVDHQVKVRGHRVECAEIERVIAADPGVDEVAVVPLDGDSLEALLARLGPAQTERLLAEVEGADERGAEATPFEIARPGFRLGLQIEDSLVRPPRNAQRDWLLRKALREWGADLEALHRIAASFVAGTEREYRDGFRAPSGSGLIDDEIMEDWQIPIMRDMAEIATTTKGDVLEVGFGRGISAELVQRNGAASHTIVEAEPAVVEQYFRPWSGRHAGRSIRLIEGKWQDADLPEASFDAVLFHAYPLDEDEFIRHVVQSTTYAEHAIPAMARVLRPGGVLTYLSNEIDSLSRTHQRLLFAHFESIETRIRRVDVPPDTRDAWWAPSMVIIRARKHTP